MTTMNFETENCHQCGIVFQVPEDFFEAREQDGRTFWCPNGHANAYEDYEDGKLERLERENNELRTEIRRLKCRLVGNNGLRDKIKVFFRGGLAK